MSLVAEAHPALRRIPLRPDSTRSDHLTTQSAPHTAIATDRTIRWATLGAAAITGSAPFSTVFRLTVFPITPGQVTQGLLIAAVVSPLQVWLAVTRARGRWARHHYGGVAILAVAHLVAFYVLGPDWIATFCYTLTGFALFLLPFPWGIVAYVGGSLAPPVLTQLLGGGELWGLFWIVGTLEYGACLAIVVTLTRTAVALRDARQTLADQAVIQERLRIDDELRATVGSALVTMIADAGRAGAQAADDPASACADVRAMVHISRRTLADVRRTVRRYQTNSAQAEIDTTIALLNAAGITTLVTLPPTGLPMTFSPELTTSLRSELSRLLTESISQRAALTVREDRVELRAVPS